MKLKFKDIQWGNKGVIIILILAAVIQLFPLVWLIDFSLNSSSDILVSGILKWPDPFQWNNYVVAWTKGRIPHFTFNSIIVCGVTILATAYLSLTLGYAFTRMKWKSSKVFLTIILLGMMIPVHTTLLPNYIIYSKTHITDTYLAMIIPYIAFAIPLGVFIMNGFLASVPKEIEEAAVIDGCGTYAIIFKIMLPITKPALMTITIMTFLNSWNEFIIAATYLSSEKYKTLPFSVMKFTTEFGTNYAYQFAVMALASLPALALYIILNKHITKGIMVGAIKG